MSYSEWRQEMASKRLRREPDPDLTKKPNIYFYGILWCVWLLTIVALYVYFSNA